VTPGELKRTGPPARRAPLRRARRKQPAELRQREAELQVIFRAEGLMSAIPSLDAAPACAVCGYDGVFVEVHHVIPKELLKRRLWEKNKPCPVEVVWDSRNALVVCADPAPNDCHGKHTSAARRIPRSVLRPENFEFAEEHGLGYVLDAAYPEARAA
jgi:hypothetical protein